MAHPQHPDLDQIEAHHLSQLHRLGELILFDQPRPSHRSPLEPLSSTLQIDQARSIGPLTAFHGHDAITLDLTGTRGDAGFNADCLERAFAEGAFDETMLTPRFSPHPLAETAALAIKEIFRDALSLTPQHHHIGLVASPCEALQHTINVTSDVGVTVVGSPPPDLPEVSAQGHLNTRNVELLLEHIAQQPKTPVLVSPPSDDPDVIPWLTELRALTRAHNTVMILDARTATWQQLQAWATVQPDAIAAFLPGGLGLAITPSPSQEPCRLEATTLTRALLRLQQKRPHTKAPEHTIEKLAGLDPALNMHTDGDSVWLRCHSTARCDELISRLSARGILLRRAGPKALALQFPADSSETLLNEVIKHLSMAITGGETLGQGDTRRHSEQRHVRIRAAAPEEADLLVPAIMKLEAKIFEPARRDSDATLRAAFLDPFGSRVIAEATHADRPGRWELVGYALGVSLEQVHDTDGPNIDVMLHRGNTLYSIAISVDPEVRGLGLGRKLKVAQLKQAQSITNQDGTPRFRFVTGRNRVGATQAMTRINRSLGGHTVAILSGQYGEPDACALYYRIPLRGPTPAHRSAGLDISNGVETVLANPPESFLAQARCNALAGPLINGIDLAQGKTPATMLARAWIAAQAPAHAHLHLKTSRACAMEMIFESLSQLRPAATIGVGLRGGDFGATTARARALSDVADRQRGSGMLNWPLLAHPAAQTAQELNAAWGAILEQAGGADKLLGVFVEVVQARTGMHLSGEAADNLTSLCASAGVPLIAIESMSAFRRAGEMTFASDAWTDQPDIIMWCAGQVAGIHSKHPLSNASTVPWSQGGELPLLRLHHNLMGLRRVDRAEAEAALEEALAAASALGISSRGVGFYRLFETGTRTDALLKALATRDVSGTMTPNGQLIVAPALDTALEVFTRLGEALMALVSGEESETTHDNAQETR